MKYQKSVKKSAKKKLLGVRLEPWPEDCKKSHVFKGYVKNTYVKRKQFFKKKVNLINLLLH